MLYRSQLKYVEYNLADIRNQFFSQLWQGFFEIKGDLIHITIENQYVKQAIESIVKEKGKNPIGTFNKETLILSTDGYANLLPSLFTNDEIDLITKEIKKKKAQSFYNAIKSLINPDAIKDSVSEICGVFVEGVGNAVGTAMMATKFAALLD